MHWGFCWEAGGAPAYWPWIQALRSLHSGILPVYLRWFVAGLLVVVWAVTQIGS